MLTLTTTHTPATDLGYLLHKNPARPQAFDLSFGRAHVFYPEVSEDCCTAALLLEVDPIKLTRGRDNASSQPYVNDRPYAASSFLSVAISQVLGSALAGTSRERPDLAATPLPLSAHLSCVPARGGEELLRALFEPLEYCLVAQSHPLDEHFPQWGESRYFTLDLTATKTVSELLSHLYVLIPVLDDEKHYWVGEDEIDKLLRHGEKWLVTHPARELIVNRYLQRRRHLTREAVARLGENEDETEAHDAEEEIIEKPISLHEQRLNAVAQALQESGAKRVLDLGCGEGRLLQVLLKDRRFDEIVGMDVSHRALERAASRLRLERMPPTQRARIELLQGALTYRDERLSGFDAAAVVEVIEHLDPPRLAAFERVLWEFARPATIVLTTPNREYNVKWETLPAGTMRHQDHRFEWTRAEFQEWTQSVAERFDYEVEFAAIGPEDEEVGAPSQMGVFSTRQYSKA